MLCLSLEASSSDISEAGMLSPNWSGTDVPGCRPTPKESALLLGVNEPFSIALGGDVKFALCFQEQAITEASKIKECISNWV